MKRWASIITAILLSVTLCNLLGLTGWGAAAVSFLVGYFVADRFSDH